MRVVNGKSEHARGRFAACCLLTGMPGAPLAFRELLVTGGITIKRIDSLRLVVTIPAGWSSSVQPPTFLVSSYIQHFRARFSVLNVKNSPL